MSVNGVRSIGLPTPPVANPAPPQPNVLRWDGEPQGWWARNGMTVGISATAGMLTGAFALNHLSTTMVSGPRVWAIPVAIGAGVAAAAAGITHLIRRSTDRTPPLPVDPPRELPQPVAPGAVRGGELNPGTHVGHGDGSYMERVPVTRTRPDGDGGTETYTDYEWRREYFAWNIGVDGQVGRRDGYATVEDAIRDAAYGDATALRRQDGRIVAYDMQARSHWGDVDDLRVDDPATDAIISPGGSIWRRVNSGPYFGYAGRTTRPDPTLIGGRSIGEHELRHRGNPNVHVDSVRSGALGHAQLADALGELQARAGDQVVVTTGGRFHVADVRSPRLDPTKPNDGFVTSKHAANVVAVEQQGGIWTSNGGWYVAPKES